MEQLINYAQSHFNSKSVLINWVLSIVYSSQ